jgi:hypothetical protein
MAEERFERDIRAMLAADLDPVHGPHPRWADAPVARRAARSRATAPRWRTMALLAAAVIGVAAVAVALSVMPRQAPVASAPPTIEPWPSRVSPTATPTTGEIALGQVAVATAFGEPAFLVRVSPAAVRGGDGVGVTIEVRVIGSLDRPFGIDRFMVIRGGREEVPGLGVSGSDPLAIPVDAPFGTEVSTTVVIPAGPDENVDLGYLGSGTSIAFHYAVHRPPPPPSPASMEGRCPTLDDYAIASLQPSEKPRPSFDPVAPDATPSTGLVTIGETGVIPALDGSPGALVRVSNVRLCDRLPDYRPDWISGPATLLLADVEIETLQTGAVQDVFIPGRNIVVANYGGRFDLNPAMPPLDVPGGNSTTTIDTGPGFAYRGTMVWEVADDGVRITIDAQRAEEDADGMRLVQFSYVARDGAPDPWVARTPEPTSDPAATPTVGEARLGEPVILGADGGTVPLIVGAVDQVPRYTGVRPAPPAAGFLEVRLTFGRGSGTLTSDAAEWVVVGADGATLAQLHLPEDGQLPPGWPNFLLSSAAGAIKIEPDFPFPRFIVAEVPAQGRISLEYRPDGGPPLVTWVLRDG